MNLGKQDVVYILECADLTLYTGWTNDLSKRLRCHNLGKASKYTRVRVPVKLVYFETHSDKRAAMRREYQIKKLSRSQKLALISLFQSN